MLSKDAANTNFIFCGLTRPDFEPTIYRTRVEHVSHYTTDTVHIVDIYMISNLITPYIRMLDSDWLIE